LGTHPIANKAKRLHDGLMAAENEDKKATGCPLRRVQLWHVVSLCLLATVNLLFVIIALLGLASYRTAMGLQCILVSCAKTDIKCTPFAESFADTDDGSTIVDKLRSQTRQTERLLAQMSSRPHCLELLCCSLSESWQLRALSMCGRKRTRS
jgi:hypothetical protein